MEHILNGQKREMYSDLYEFTLARLNQAKQTIRATYDAKIIEEIDHQITVRMANVGKKIRNKAVRKEINEVLNLLNELHEIERYHAYRQGFADQFHIESLNNLWRDVPHFWGTVVSGRTTRTGTRLRGIPGGKRQKKDDFLPAL